LKAVAAALERRSMASTLAQQLAQLSSAKGPQEKYVKGKASLLFDYQKAADVSAETLLGIAQQGACWPMVLL
jgi:hypothetical protein